MVPNLDAGANGATCANPRVLPDLRPFTNDGAFFDENSGTENNGGMNHRGCVHITLARSTVERQFIPQHSRGTRESQLGMIANQ